MLSVHYLRTYYLSLEVSKRHGSIATNGSGRYPWRNSRNLQAPSKNEFIILLYYFTLFTALLLPVGLCMRWRASHSRYTFCPFWSLGFPVWHVKSKLLASSLKKSDSLKRQPIVLCLLCLLCLRACSCFSTCCTAARHVSRLSSQTYTPPMWTMEGCNSA